MRRRDFIAFTGTAAISPALAPWSRNAHAQGSAFPVVGFLSSRTPEQAEYLLAAIRKGLSESGFVDGQNVAIEPRYAEGHYDRLPALADDLVGRQVAVIIAGGTSKPALAATKTIPIVFTTGSTRSPPDLCGASTTQAQTPQA
jgi:putative ABC transport system substrate-binding protein